jgi:hypothetical protein
MSVRARGRRVRELAESQSLCSSLMRGHAFMSEGEGSEGGEEVEKLGEVRVLFCSGGIMQDEGEIVDVVDKGGVGREDVQQVVGMDELRGIAMGCAEGEGTEETLVGGCESAVLGGRELLTRLPWVQRMGQNPTKGWMKSRLKNGSANGSKAGMGDSGGVFEGRCVDVRLAEVRVSPGSTNFGLNPNLNLQVQFLLTSDLDLNLKVRVRRVWFGFEPRFR